MTSNRNQSDQPLNMTVHSMPDDSVLVQNAVSRTRSGRWKMLMVLLLCAAPVIASYFTYYVIRPEGRRNFGELIDPQRPLPNLTGINLSGEQVNLQTLKGQWLLISVSGGECNEMCQRHLYLQRQIREGLGKEKSRLDWVWLVDDEAPISKELQTAVNQAVVIRVPKKQLNAWLVPQTKHDLSDHLFLVDPIGNWMMRFPPQLQDQQSLKVKRDLERVLRASAFWDQSGR
jgi:hypothetical protein